MFFEGLVVLLVGCLAVPNLILAKQPNAKQVLDKIVPYQGWIGLVAALIGIVRIPSMLSALQLLKFGVKGLLIFIFYAAAVVVLIILGFILGIGVFKSFIKDPTAQQKMDQALAKVIPYQATLGLIAIVDGVVLIINSFTHIIF
jgi:hypothetical protein